MFSSKSIFVCALVVLCTSTTQSFARPRDAHPSLITLRGGSTPAFAGADGLSTGFEQPEFLPGSIVGQNGWDCSDNAIVSSLVATFKPDTGSQHLRLIDNTGEPNSAISFVLSTQFEAMSQADVSVRYSINNVTPGPNGGAEYEFVPQSAAQGFVVTRMVLGFTGDIFVLDDVGAGPEFIDTGADWLTGDYHTLGILDRPAGPAVFPR